MTVPLARLDVTTPVVKRAQYEAFEFTVDDCGVRVRNGSHPNPEDHEYLVAIDDGLPSECECPADANYDDACKHRVAVAIRTPVLAAAIDQQLTADGGSVTRDDATSGEKEPIGGQEDAPSECDCDELAGEFPCWECARTERRELPNSSDQQR